MRSFKELHGLKGKVIVQHKLFGEDTYDCNMLQVIDDDRVGIIIKGREFFVDKQQIVDFQMNDKIYVVRDEMLTITVIVNKM